MEKPEAEKQVEPEKEGATEMIARFG